MGRWDGVNGMGGGFWTEMNWECRGIGDKRSHAETAMKTVECPSRIKYRDEVSAI